MRCGAEVLNQQCTFFSVLTPTMHLSLRLLAALSSAAFASWYAAFVFECYYQGPRVGLQSHPRNHEPPFPGATADNLFWFLQISDIHLSIVNKLAVAVDLRLFCTETVPTIAPALVLVTGDITHAKFPDERWSQQFEEEWQTYGDITRETGVRERQPWLDIRGNHDAFDVESHSHKNNIFLKYASSFSTHGSYSYVYTHKTPFGNYSFIAMDACPHPGPRRPFNFFGVLHDEDLSILHSLLAQSALHFPNQTLWFSHYPSATISGDHRTLRELMASAVAHVCGHLHTLANLVPQMYGHHPSGHLELELADFKDNRRYRLLAIDHDLFSFTDTQLRHWPLVLITNPKDAHFVVPGREPLGRMAHSSHVRMLVFSPHGVKSVSVWLDGHPLPPATRVHSGPLYTTPWSPQQVATGQHTITVVAEDAAGNRHNTSHHFFLDGSVAPLDVLPQLLLLTDMRSLFRVVFLFVWLSLLTGLALSWVNRAQPLYFYPLVRSRTVFYPFFVILLYFGTGPWCVAEVVTGVRGLIWAHGVQVSGHFIPGSMTYLYGTIQLLLWYIPLTYYLNHLLSLSYSRWLLLNISRHLAMLFLFLLHCGWCLTFSPYGKIALILSPGVSWTIPLSLCLILRAQRIHHRMSGRAI